jgi:hypothetical protein
MTVYLDKLEGIAAKIAVSAFPGYKGKRFKIATASCFSPNLNHWEGGTRTYQVLISRRGERRQVPECGTMFVGSHGPIDIPPGFLIIEHSIFCGKDMGLTFLIRPDELDTLALPAPVDLTDDERTVLLYTRSRKSSYAGRDRQQMAWDDGKRISPETWKVTQDALIAKGLLTKSTAITAKGLNAVSDCSL